jgi:hypothetical protein
VLERKSTLCDKKLLRYLKKLLAFFFSLTVEYLQK